jgi:hypothetical protein
MNPIFFNKKKLVGFFLGSPVASNNRDLAQDVVLDERNVRTEKKNCRTSSNTPGGEVRSTIFIYISITHLSIIARLLTP